MAWIRQQKPEPERVTSPSPSMPEPARSVAPPPPRRERSQEALVNIGQSVEIRGTLTGNEDLTIEGMVDGKILVKDHALTIGANGRITAEVHAKTVIVVGQIVGNITADDKVEIAPSGSVQGDIRAPRVSISDGAKFKGSIDMERKSGATSTAPARVSGVSSVIADSVPRSASASQG